VPPVSNTVENDAIVHLKQIAIPISATDPPPIVAAKMNRAEALRQEISSCEQMDQKAKDFLTAGTGDLGSTNVSKLPVPVRDAVINLPIGMLSMPVRTPDGVAVDMVCERTPIAGAKVATAAAQPAPAPAAPTAPATGPGYAAPQTAPAAQGAPLPAISKTDENARTQLANQIGSKRLDQMADHFLRDLRAAAYIEIRL
jgi:hypothetical protein